MDDKKTKVHVGRGDIDPDDVTTGGVGAGGSPTDTGGLDAAGNELGATSLGSSEGRDENKREDDADKAVDPSTKGH